MFTTEAHAEGRDVEAALQRLAQSEAIDSGDLARALPLLTEVAAVPVVGNVDADQSARMTERLLSELTRTRARHAILELTGLHHCDPRTAESFVRMARAASLLGAECVLSGLQPGAAHALVEHGIDLSRLKTRRNLQQALQEILAQPGRARGGQRADGGAAIV